MGPALRRAQGIRQVSEFAAYDGLTIHEARRLAATKQLKAVRVVIQDGEHLLVTSDYRTDRLNVETKLTGGTQRITGEPYLG